MKLFCLVFSRYIKNSFIKLEVAVLSQARRSITIMPDALTSNTKDFVDTKLYIEGAAADGLKLAEFMARYPQFDKYDCQFLCQSMSCLQKAYK